MIVTAPGMKNRLYPTYNNLIVDFVSTTKDGPFDAVLMLQSTISATRAAMVDLPNSNDAVDLTKGKEAADVGVVTACNGIIKVPTGWPMASSQSSKRPKGGQRTVDRIVIENLSRFHF